MNKLNGNKKYKLDEKKFKVKIIDAIITEPIRPFRNAELS
jgi:hypothetical protein